MSCIRFVWYIVLSPTYDVVRRGLTSIRYLGNRRRPGRAPCRARRNLATPGAARTLARKVATLVAHARPTPAIAAVILKATVVGKRLIAGHQRHARRRAEQHQQADGRARRELLEPPHGMIVRASVTSRRIDESHTLRSATIVRLQYGREGKVAGQGSLAVNRTPRGIGTPSAHIVSNTADLSVAQPMNLLEGDNIRPPRRSTRSASSARTPSVSVRLASRRQPCALARRNYSRGESTSRRP